jgi:hypothetical protein
MQKPKLYRGPGNNGVQVLVTEAAYLATRQQLGYLDGLAKGTVSPTYDVTRLRIIAEGTMTFVAPGRYLTSGARQLHYGTHEMIDALGALFHIVPATCTIGVPFCQGDPHMDEFQLTLGYGYDPDRFDALVAEALAIAEANAAA